VTRLPSASIRRTGIPACPERAPAKFRADRNVRPTSANHVPIIRGFQAWPALLLCGMGAAFWPVWRWYLLRITDGSDEPWGILALLSLLVIRWRDRIREGALQERHFATAAAVLAIYLIAFDALVPLGRAILAAVAFASVLLRGRGMAGLWGLLGLSLPILATLQFYLGFPLRMLAAQASELTLRAGGYEVIREGTVLRWAGESILVDAPCSGVHMLWTGAFLAMLLAARHRLDLGRTVLLGSASMVIVIAANVLRATALFFKEANLVPAPEWTHAGTGVLLFVTGAWLILTLADRLQPQPSPAS